MLVTKQEKTPTIITRLSDIVSLPFQRNKKYKSKTSTNPYMECARRVVVTGLGALTPLNTQETKIDALVDEFWQKLLDGENAIKTIEDSRRVDLEGFRVKIGALINHDPIVYGAFDKKDKERTDLFTQYALVAANAALTDARIIDSTEIDREKIGVIIGSGIGGITTIEDGKKGLVTGETKPRRIGQLMSAKAMPNAASIYIAMKYGFNGSNYAVACACASAGHAIYDAALNIKAGKADVMITGGAECAITQLGYGSFASLGALTRNTDPDKASRPFDANRDGFVLGEGSGIIVLEEREHARARHAPIYAELLGSRTTCDAYHITHPDPDGTQITRAMRLAIEDAGIEPSDIGYVNAHGTSTKLNDEIETKAIMKVFGEHAFNGLLVSSTKSMIGHALGAAGALEAIASVLSLRSSFVHPTINYETPDPELADPSGRYLDYVANKARVVNGLQAVMSNSFGFGGANAVLVFRR